MPGAETIYGLGRFQWVRDLCVGIMGYVPDLEPFDEPGTVALRARDGREFEIGISVCYDNSFLDPYVDVAREYDVDFHLVLSNEAWYESSHEADQMLAFSAFAAITTGRSVARATNSGVSALFGPDGSERARLVVDGKDREVEGTLEVVVPIPAGEEERAPTFFVRTRPAWLAAWILVAAVGIGRAGRASRGADPAAG